MIREFTCFESFPSMVKKFTASRKQLKPDTRFNSLLISKFVNCLMYDGKKSVASGAFYRAMEIVQKQLPNEESAGCICHGSGQREAGDRSSLQARRWCDLPGSNASEFTTTAGVSIRWILEAVRGRKGRPIDKSLG
jgi:small subunit ribosomal protein S7